MGNVTIPQQLVDSKCRFLQIRQKDKLPQEKEWQLLNNYTSDDPKLQKHLEYGGNYGVLPRDDICIVDIDNLQYFEKYNTIDAFKDTFIVRSGSGKGLHIYLRNSKYKLKIKMYSLLDNKNGHLGEFYGSGCDAYVVGANSIHPDGGTYEVVNNVPIKEYSDAYIDEHLFGRVYSSLNKTATDHIPEKSITRVAKSTITSKRTISEEYDLHVEQIGMPVNPIIHGDEIQGSHPVHGSKTGFNFSINPVKNIWHCFRDDCGGDALYLFAIMEGIITCGEDLTKDQITECVSRLEKKGYVKKYSDDDLEVKTLAELLDGVEVQTNPILDVKLESDNFISRYMATQAKKSDSYQEYNFAGALAILSACVQRNAVLKLKMEDVYPNIWSFCLGTSGVARKTTAIKFAKKSLDQGSISDQKFPNDFSPEAFIECLETIPQSFLIRDEFSSFLSALEKKSYMAGMMPTLCALYDNEEITRITKQKRTTIPKPYLTMLVATTPKNLENVCSMDMLTTGYFFRYLWFWPNHDRKKMDIDEIDEGSIEDDEVLKSDILRYWDFFKNHPEIRFHILPEDMKNYRKWVAENDAKISESQNDILGGIFSRIQVHILKLAMLFTVGENDAIEKMDRENSITIPTKHMKEATRLVEEYFFKMAEIVANKVEMSDRKNDFNTVLSVFENTPIISRSELLLKVRLPSKVLDDILKQLVNEIGCIEEQAIRVKPTDKKLTRYYTRIGAKK